MNALDPFYLIVDSSHWLERLLPHGLKLVQLRIKDRSEADIRAEIRRARDLCSAAGAVLIINDHWRAALDLGCDFLHLGQEDLAAADHVALRASGARIGVSTHSLDELSRALEIEPSYIALGPIYPTILKKMPWQPQGLETLSLWRNRIGDRPLVAIGGLTPERGVLALRAGADSVAVVTDVLLHEQPEARLAEWLAVTQNWREEDSV